MNTSSIELKQDGLKGEPILWKSTKISDLKNLFKDEQLRSEMPQDQIVYDVEAYLPVSEGTEGGLFFWSNKNLSRKGRR